MKLQNTEYLIIGGGPGDTPTAMALVAAGKSVLLVEKGAGLGGTCLFEGCIPSKIFHETARRLREIREAAALEGVKQVRDGKVRALIKGWIHTDILMGPVLKQLRTARRISHIFITELSSYSKLLFITNAAINIAPDLSIKSQIIQNAVDLANAPIAGIAIGAQVPIMPPSQTDPPTARLAPAAIAVLMHQHWHDPKNINSERIINTLKMN